jgi:sugar lactone lactonase YvrE
MKKALAVLVLLAVAGLAALMLVPGGIDPVVWEPPPAFAGTPATALNERLKPIQWLGRSLPGPETLFVDAEGRLLTGLLDGRVVRLQPGSEEAETLVNTGGRPMAVATHPDGRLFIADAHRGLLALDAQRHLEVLATGEGGVPFRFLDDLVIASDGTVYFTDASSRRSVEDFPLELLEHRASGRVLSYVPATGKVSRLFGAFSFPNGIALSPGEDFLVVSETGDYRLWRLWLTGPKAGQRELFTASLPGFPDNVRWSPERRVYWVAIGSLRKPEVDALAPFPRLRKLVSRLPAAFQPAPDRHAYALAVDETGQVVETLQDLSPDSYSPVSCVTEAGGFLYLGSFVRSGLARLPFPKP